MTLDKNALYHFAVACLLGLVATAADADLGVAPDAYTGREAGGSGLLHYRARDLDPAVGRFMQRDPLGLSGGINDYAYVGGNPIMATDPGGLQAEIGNAQINDGGPWYQIFNDSLVDGVQVSKMIHPWVAIAYKFFLPDVIDPSSIYLVPCPACLDRHMRAGNRQPLMMVQPPYEYEIFTRYLIEPPPSSDPIIDAVSPAMIGHELQHLADGRILGMKQMVAAYTAHTREALSKGLDARAAYESNPFEQRARATEEKIYQFLRRLNEAHFDGKSPDYYWHLLTTPPVHGPSTP